MRNLLLTGLMAMGFILPSMPSEASVLDLAYTQSTGNKILLRLDGSLGSDNNTFTVDQALQVFINGIDPGVPIGLGTSDSVFLGTNPTPVATLDGSFVNVAVGAVNSLVAFAVNNPVAAQYGQNLEGAYPSYGGDYYLHSFVLANYSATVEAVPEPASLALLGLGVTGIAAVRRRRAG